MAATLAAALQSQASALRPTTSTVMRPDGSRFRLAKDALGQEVLLSSDEAAERNPAQVEATVAYLGLNKDTGASPSEDANGGAAAAADPHTDAATTSTAAAAEDADASTVASTSTSTNTGTTTGMDVSACPRFESSDPHMLAHLDEFGYVVVRNAMGSVDNRREAEELLWAFLEVPVPNKTTGGGGHDRIVVADFVSHKDIQTLTSPRASHTVPPGTPQEHAG